MSSLLRLNLYVPQHQLALLIFIAWLIVLLRINVYGKNLPGWLMLLPLPGISLMVGGAAGIVALAIEVFKKRTGRFNTDAFLTFLAVIVSWVFVYFAGIIGHKFLADPFINRDFQGLPPGGLRVVLTPLYLFTSFGLLFLLGVWGVARHFLDRHSAGVNNGHLPLVLLLSIWLVLCLAELTVSHPGLAVEAELKISFLFLPGLILGAALFLNSAMTQARKTKFPVVLAIVLLLGIPSTLHDVYWHMAPARQWQVVVPRADVQALHWIKGNTPVQARFQQYPEQPFLLGGQDSWLPVFTGRGVVFAPRSPYGAVAEKDMKELFEPKIAVYRKLELVDKHVIEYLYLSRYLQPDSYTSLDAQFTQAGWRAVYRNAGASVWRVDRIVP